MTRALGIDVPISIASASRLLSSSTLQPLQLVERGAGVLRSSPPGESLIPNGLPDGEAYCLFEGLNLLGKGVARGH